MNEVPSNRIVRTACPAHCGGDACGILAHIQGDRVVKIEPADFTEPGYKRICMRGLTSLDITYHPDRLKYPMKRIGERGEGKFARISWEEALDTIASKFKDIASKYGWQSLGWVLGGPGSGTTKFGAYLRLASLTQSTRVSAWGYGDSALPCGSRVLFGTHTPMFLLAGWDDPELLIVWGTNPGETYPSTGMRKIMDAKEKGSQVVVIDPRFTVTASKADEYLGIKPGTDAALALGLMHVIFQKGLQDEEFIHMHTVGPYLVRTDTGAFLREKDLLAEGSDRYMVWDNVSAAAHASDTQANRPALTGNYSVNGISCKPAFQLLAELTEVYTPEKVSKITGIPSQLIVRLAQRIGTARSVSIMVHMGFTRTYYGDISTRAVGTLATVTGNLSLTPTAGHRPVVLNWAAFLRPELSKPGYSRLGILQLYDAVISGKPFPIKSVWFSFINFLNQCANSNKIANEVFPNLDFIVTTDLFMTSTAKYSDIVLPTCSYLEFSDLVLGPLPYLQLQQKAIDPLYESKSDVTIASELAAKLGFSDYFDKGEEGFIDLMLASGHPSVEGINVENLKAGPMLTLQAEKDIQTKEVKFSTPSGKIEFYSEGLGEYGQALPDYIEPLESLGKSFGNKYPLAFVQGHSRFRTHSMFANSPTLLNLNPEPRLYINPVDADQRGISDGDLVTVFNDRGRIKLKVTLSNGIQAGVVDLSEGWWFNQFAEGGVNALTHDTINPVQEAVFEPNMAMNDVAVQVSRAGE